MSAPTRTPFETIINEADAIGQHARAAAEFAGPVDPGAAYQFVMCAERAEYVVGQMRRRMRETEKAADGKTS